MCNNYSCINLILVNCTQIMMFNINSVLYLYNSCIFINYVTILIDVYELYYVLKIVGLLLKCMPNFSCQYEVLIECSCISLLEC